MIFFLIYFESVCVCRIVRDVIEVIMVGMKIQSWDYMEQYFFILYLFLGDVYL